VFRGHASGRSVRKYTPSATHLESGNKRRSLGRERARGTGEGQFSAGAESEFPEPRSTGDFGALTPPVDATENRRLPISKTTKHPETRSPVRRTRQFENDSPRPYYEIVRFSTAGGDGRYYTFLTTVGRPDE